VNKQTELKVFLELPAHVEVEGSSAALRNLAESFRTATGNATSWQVTSAGPDEVHVISVRRTDSLVQIRYSSGALSIEGAQSKLDVLADNIEYVAFSDPNSAHIHVEHHEGHPYLAPGSIPLVVSRDDDA